jgi:hypothetical protein
MRAHGVAAFPDPDSNGNIRTPPGSASAKDSAAFRSAYGSCRALAPNGLLVNPSEGILSAQQEARLQQQMLAFAACMRSHGVPTFPDPTVANGHIHLRVDADQRIDANSPIVTAALAACRSKLSGVNGRYAGKLVAGAAGR